MIANNCYFLLVMLAFALRKPRHMEWLSGAVAAYGLALLAVVTERAFVDLQSEGNTTYYATRVYAIWFGIVVFLSAETIWNDIKDAVRQRFARRSTRGRVEAAL